MCKHAEDAICERDGGFPLDTNMDVNRTTCATTTATASCTSHHVSHYMTSQQHHMSIRMQHYIRDMLLTCVCNTVARFGANLVLATALTSANVALHVALLVSCPSILSGSVVEMRCAMVRIVTHSPDDKSVMVSMSSQWASIVPRAAAVSSTCRN